MQQRDIQVVELLLSQGADPNAQQANGFTCLHICARKGQKHIEIAKMLLAKGADPEQVTEESQVSRPIGHSEGNRIF